MLKIVAIGELSSWAQLAFEDYHKRLRAPFNVTTIQIPAPKSKTSVASKQQAEAKLLLKHVKDSEHVVLLDERGKSMSSTAFAKMLNQDITEARDVTFILGGADGFSPELYERSKRMLSLSSFVLPHALARVVLIEQIYRAYTLHLGHPYHRE